MNNAHTHSKLRLLRCTHEYIQKSHPFGVALLYIENNCVASEFKKMNFIDQEQTVPSRIKWRSTCNSLLLRNQVPLLLIFIC